MSMSLLLIALLCLEFVWARVNHGHNAPYIITPLGGLKGSYKTSHENKTRYMAFEGIPYALPPIGDLRFEPPRHMKSWGGILEATKMRSRCLQYNNNNGDIMGEEDCLYLNVYAPVQNNIKLMPVIFSITGDTFHNDYLINLINREKYFMNHNVIYVTFTYRLGPFGFLSTEDKVVPGNMGLKDQSMALHWVSNNIIWFSGNAQKITLVGTNAGGASVHYHYLSKMSAGLFQGGISASGTAFNCWAQIKKASAKAKILGDLLGCPTTYFSDMIQCLKHRAAKSIVEAIPLLYSVSNPYGLFGPVVEKKSNNPFIDRQPVDIINSGDVQDVPWIAGLSSDAHLYVIKMSSERMKDFLTNWNIGIPRFLDFTYTVPNDMHISVSERIIKHYLENESVDKLFPQMVADRFFLVDSEKAARMQATVNKNPVWYYYFTHEKDQILNRNLDDGWYGDNVDEYLILNTPWLNPIRTQMDYEMMHSLVGLCVSFAKEGVPRIAGKKWPKLDPSEKKFSYLHIAGPTKNMIQMESDANFGNKDFWNSIDFDENKLKRDIADKDEL